MKIKNIDMQSSSPLYKFENIWDLLYTLGAIALGFTIGVLI